MDKQMMKAILERPVGSNIFTDEAIKEANQGLDTDPCIWCGDIKEAGHDYCWDCEADQDSPPAESFLGGMVEDDDDQDSPPPSSFLRHAVVDEVQKCEEYFNGQMLGS